MQVSPIECLGQITAKYITEAHGNVEEAIKAAKRDFEAFKKERCPNAAPILLEFTISFIKLYTP